MTTSPKILIVDDSAPFSLILRKMLLSIVGHDAEIVHVNSVQAARDAVVAAVGVQFTHYFVDFRFPGGEDGCMFLEFLKSQGILQSGRVKAFLVTSEPTPANVDRALEAGAVGVIAKPFDKRKLAAMLA